MATQGGRAYCVRIDSSESGFCRNENMRWDGLALAFQEFELESSLVLSPTCISVIVASAINLAGLALTILHTLVLLDCSYRQISRAMA